MCNTICNKKVTGGIYNISEYLIALNNTHYNSVKFFVVCIVSKYNFQHVL